MLSKYPKISRDMCVCTKPQLQSNRRIVSLFDSKEEDEEDEEDLDIQMSEIPK